MARKALKTILSLVMVLSMLVSISCITAFANPAPELVQNYEDTYYHQDGSAASASDWEVHLSKTAAVTDIENVFDITLLVETKDTSIELAGSTHGAVVLVLDASNSMEKAAKGCFLCGEDEDHTNHKGSGSFCPGDSGKSYERSKLDGNRCANCGFPIWYHVQGEPACTFQESPSHMTILKSAVKSFLDNYVAGAAEGDKRLVSIVEFYTNARTVQSWIDVNNSNNMALVKSAVDSLTTDHYSGKTDIGGTNMEAGLVLGRNLLNASDVSSIPVGNQSLILFSDGAPTAAVGDVNSTSTSSVNYDGGDRGEKSDNKDKDDLSSILAAVNAKKLAMAYNTDASLLQSVFGASNVITTSADSLAVDLAAEAGSIVTTTTNANGITDPMGYGVSMVSVSSAYNGTWDLSQYTPVISNGITSYTITYQVELDPTVIAEDPNYPGYTVFTPANGATTLNYTVGEDATPVSADFNEPDIRGRLPENYSPFVSIVKSADKDSYEVGETVTWTVIVTNDSDYPAYNVIVVDQMIGINETIQVLEPGASQSFSASAVAAEAGRLRNVAVVSWADGDEIPDTDEPNEPKDNSTEEIVDVVEPAPVYYNLTVNYVDEAGVPVAGSDATTALEEGSPYVTAPKSVDGYDFKEWDASSDAAEGIMDSDKTVVYIYTAVQLPPPPATETDLPEPPPAPVYYNLTVSYVDESGAPVADSDVIIGLEEDSLYSTSPKTIGGYEFKEWDASSDAAEGVMDSDKNVVYIYSVKEVPPPQPVYYTLTVSYVDESGAPVADSDVTQGLEEGSTYSTAPKSVDGYEFKEWDASSDAAAGIMDSDKVVTYIYSVKQVPPPQPPVEPDPVYYTLTVNYVDENGAAVADSDVSAGLPEGSAYSTSAKSVDGYDFKEWDASSDAVAGIMDSDKVVTYIYSVKQQPPVNPPVNPPVEPPVNPPVEPPVNPPVEPSYPVYPSYPSYPSYPVAPTSDDGLVEILDEEVPLAAVPVTGDISTLLLAISTFSGSGLALIGLNRKKEEE